ncbi:MAG TPA: sigma-70 family RNA polymerase sigma factor [Tepidisphaeraceae bacterium]|nr:sigma-70 family RNA polymerase sigma factor [Tepidisphaeraceae bacterium]
MGDAGDAQWRALLAEQFGQSSRLLYRLAYGILREPGSAEDACQQALTRAWERRGELRDPALLQSWLARVVVTESLQTRRRGQIERRVLSDPARQPHEQPPPDTDLREGVLKAMEQLPEQARLIVALRVMQGVSGNDVKDLLGCSAAEVSRQLHRGLEMLRGLLADWKPA